MVVIIILQEMLRGLESNRDSAKSYLDDLQSKKLKTRRVRKAIDYWEGNYDAFERAIMLAKFYSTNKQDQI